MSTAGINDEQLYAFRQELVEFVPPESFDVHAHLYRGVDAIGGLPQHVLNDRQEVGYSEWHRSLSTWLGEYTPTNGLFFAFPKQQVDFCQANDFVLQEIAGQSDSRALLLIHPQDDPSKVLHQVDASRAVGFKVYHVYAERLDTPNAEPGEFLPEWAWEIANQRDLVIMLHMVRSRALCDEANHSYIRRQCLSYPYAKLILAHAARGFCAVHTVQGIGSLRGLDNVYFDTSVVCEPAAFEAILQEFGPARLMFGSDFPVSEMIGRCVSIGDDFVWLDAENVNWKALRDVRPTLVGIESLLALKQACRTARLTDVDVEKIFRTNARRLLEIEPLSEVNVTQQIYERAKKIIPGGSNLLSKRPEMYAPGRWPAYYREARGCHVIDLDDREYCDMTTSGIGSCLLGYADADVTDAVVRRVQLGSMSSLNSVEEVELAELLISIHPWAEQVRFCRTGGESMAVAARVARAATRRDVIAFCGYHGWSDWYLAANLSEQSSATSPHSDSLAGHLLPGLSPDGVPQGLAGTALPFKYNKIDQLQQILERNEGQVAAVVMEPFRSAEPEPGFLAAVRELCDESGVVLIFDEITSGWRFGLGGIHLTFGIAPDIAVFAKALGNGHPIGALVGRSRFMEAVQTTFVSSTYWTEAVGPTAALATIRKMQKVDVPAHVYHIGELFRDGLRELGQQHVVPIQLSGRGALLHVSFDHPEAAALGTLFTDRMLDHGILASSGFYPSFAHQEHHVQAYLASADLVFEELAQSIQLGDTAKRLTGGIKQCGFSRLT